MNNRNTRKRCEICSKSTIKTPERIYDNTLFQVKFLKQVNLFQPSVAFYVEASHLICSANQMAGFYMKCSNFRYHYRKRHPPKANTNKHLRFLKHSWFMNFGKLQEKPLRWISVYNQLHGCDFQDHLRTADSIVILQNVEKKLFIYLCAVPRNSI